MGSWPAFSRFLLSGGLNTALTYGLYLLCLQIMPYAISYSISFGCGIAIAYLLSRYFVFEGARTGSRSLLFPLIYLIQYLVGLLIVFVWVDLLLLHASLAPLASILATVPITFLLSRWVFNG